MAVSGLWVLAPRAAFVLAVVPVVILSAHLLGLWRRSHGLERRVLGWGLVMFAIAVASAGLAGFMLAQALR